MLSNLPLPRQVYDEDNSCVVECIIVHFYCAGSSNCFQFYNAKDIPNMYSIHSWIGLGTVILFSSQVR